MLHHNCKIEIVQYIKSCTVSGTLARRVHNGFDARHAQARCGTRVVMPSPKCCALKHRAKHDPIISFTRRFNQFFGFLEHKEEKLFEFKDLLDPSSGQIRELPASFMCIIP